MYLKGAACDGSMCGLVNWDWLRKRTACFENPWLILGFSAKNPSISWSKFTLDSDLIISSQ